MYSRVQKKLEKNRKDKKETDFAKNENLIPFFLTVNCHAGFLEGLGLSTAPGYSTCIDRSTQIR
jgi:hypothetical protein